MNKRAYLLEVRDRPRINLTQAIDGTQTRAQTPFLFAKREPSLTLSNRCPKWLTALWWAMLLVNCGIVGFMWHEGLKDGLSVFEALVIGFGLTGIVGLILMRPK